MLEYRYIERGVFVLLFYSTVKLSLFTVLFCLLLCLFVLSILSTSVSASLAQWLELWSRKSGVESSDLSRGCRHFFSLFQWIAKLISFFFR